MSRAARRRGHPWSTSFGPSRAASCCSGWSPSWRCSPSGWYARSTVEAVRINSPAYERIDTQKDLINDLSPPALNVVRAMLLVTGVDPGAGPRSSPRSSTQFGQEKAAFQKAEAAWRDRLADGPERTSLLERVIPQGAAFYEIVDRELIPALRGGAKEKANVDKIVNERLAPLHKQQAESVRALVDATERKLKQEQDAAAELVASRGWTQAAILVASLAFTLLVVGLTARGVRAKTAETIATVRPSPAGDYARRMVEGADEFGRVGRHVNEMAEMLRQVAEINKSQAIIEFKPDGSIVTANANFLQLDGLLAGRTPRPAPPACSSIRRTPAAPSTASSGPGSAAARS